MDLKPAAGQPLPVKPLMARTTPTPNDLLRIPAYAKPDRVDELMKRSEPRAQDPFNLPPPTGGAAPSLPPNSGLCRANAPDNNATDTRHARYPRPRQETEPPMPTRVRKAVFPVAGLGTRLLPATKSIPKEMITVVDRPLIQYAVDEAREAGIEELIFVTGRGKSALDDYFDLAFELEATMREQAARAWMRSPPRAPPSARSSVSASSSRLGSVTPSGARATLSATSRSQCCFPTS